MSSSSQSSALAEIGMQKIEERGLKTYKRYDFGYFRHLHLCTRKRNWLLSRQDNEKTLTDSSIRGLTEMRTTHMTEYSPSHPTALRFTKKELCVSTPSVK